MKVLVKGKNGRGLMPTSPRKARVLLEQGKAKVVRKVPFTIMLLYKTGCAHEALTLGVDTGSQHIGICAASEKEAVVMAEYSLRPTMEKRALLEARRAFRRGRRYRKVRYRHPKYRPHTKRTWTKMPVKRNGHLTHWKKVPAGYPSVRKEGWLPPSMQSKADMHLSIINRHLEALPDGTGLRIEAARFDIARIKDPSVHGALYQKGPMYDYENIRAYVFDRDGYRCRACGAKAGSRRADGTSVKLIAHHIDFRSRGATDNPDRMASVCDRCHTASAHQDGGILYRWMEEGRSFARGYRDMTHMNIIRRRLMAAYPSAAFTYGNITNADRRAMLLPKSHANDAAAIAAGGRGISVKEPVVYYQQVRCRKRSLYEANPRKGRKSPNREARRNRKNTVSVTIAKHSQTVTFHVYDRVSLQGRKGWISGFTGRYAYVKDEHDRYISLPGKNYKQVPLSMLGIISHNNNWLTGALSPIGR